MSVNTNRAGMAADLSCVLPLVLTLLEITGMLWHVLCARVDLRVAPRRRLGVVLVSLTASFVPAYSSHRTPSLQ